MATKNSNLHTAKKQKNDEFYTLLTDIENELKHYKEHFRNKVVYCNCDDPIESNFFKYFSLNFEHLGLKKLITTGYKENGKGVVYIYEGDKNGNRIPDLEEIEVKELQGNGDFRSAECIEFLKESDIVVTNPPFSLFRDYVATLVEYGKQFLIIGNKNAITYKEIFPLIKDNKMWLGISSPNEYKLPNGEITKQVNGLCKWFTNLEHKKRNYPLDLYMKYSNEYYQKYDNYNAIEVSKTCEIPMDYEGVMGVPITFLDKYNPEQFEILDARNYTDNVKLQNKSTYLIKDKDGAINGKATYARILIRHKK
jgi:hypothetical protein